MIDYAYVWCPGYPLMDATQHRRAMTMTRRLTTAMGLEVLESPLLSQFFGAGAWLSADIRIADCERALSAHPSPRLLIAARGGYGCIELAETFLKRADSATPMPTVIGYSDLTVLHAIWRTRAWGETLYGFLPAVSAGERSLSSTISLLRGESIHLSALSDPDVQIVHPGAASGTLFAACLRVLAGLVGTPAMPDLSGTILAIEDVDERPYRIDRDLQQLFLAGTLRGLVGLVFGTFPADHPTDYAGPSPAAICKRWAARLGVPAIFALPFGHVDDPLTLPCGRQAELLVTVDSWQLLITCNNHNK